jgi:hypothetical protein
MNKTIGRNTLNSEPSMSYETQEVRVMWDSLLKEVPFGTILIKVFEKEDPHYLTRTGATELRNVCAQRAGYAPTLRACKVLEIYLDKYVRKQKSNNK